MIDFLSVERTLYIQGKHHYKNPFAGILSIFLVIGLIVVSYYLSEDYIYNLSPIYQEHSVSGIEGWRDHELYVMFASPKSLLGKSWWYDLGFVTNQYTPLAVVECTNEQYAIHTD